MQKIRGNFQSLIYFKFLQKKQKNFECQYFLNLKNYILGPFLPPFGLKPQNKIFSKKSYMSILRLYVDVHSCKKIQKYSLGPFFMKLEKLQNKIFWKNLAPPLFKLHDNLTSSKKIGKFVEAVLEKNSGQTKKCINRQTDGLYFIGPALP